jgi:hypothetical protein
MENYVRKNPFTRRFAAAALVLVCGLQSFAQTAAVKPSALSAAENELVANITIPKIKEMTAALSAPDMEGRGTGQPGGEKAANWIAEKFKAMGLKPLGDKNSYLQKVDFKETVATPETSFSIGEQSLVHGSDFAFVPMNNGNKNVTGDMVFVSYAIQSKSSGINMIEGVPLSGKVAVMIEGPPPGIPEADWTKQRAHFALVGALIRAGVAAIVFIGHDEASRPPDEMISYISRRQLGLPGEEGYPAAVPPFIYVSAKGAEKLFAKAGLTRAEALEKGATRDFKPVDLKQKAKLVAKYDVKKVTGYNVVGVLEGSDPKLKSEAIIFSAHYDAYGKEGDKIYHGAADNALGTSEMLAVAEAYSKASQKPKRSLIFAAVTGEEYGLYGSKHWAKNPTWDVKKVAANLNLDGVGTEVYGPVKTMVGYGAEHSTLGAMLESAARAFDVTVIPDPMPDEKIFYRSDHYSFVERGIPAIKLLGAPAGDKDVWIKRMKAWQKTDYHQPGDIIQPNWAWEGPETMARVIAVMSWRISEDAAMPSWLPASRFAKLERGNTKEIPDEQ